MDRRRFVVSAAGAAGAAAVFSGAPAWAQNGRANSKLRTAHVGVGGMGNSDLGALASHSGLEVAAVCDIDEGRMNSAGEKHPNAKRYIDWREMLDAEGDKIDAVVCSTPDHMHAAIAMVAMNMGKHVYCQKPLTHSIHEARALAQRVARGDVVSQMGTQNASRAHKRQAIAMLQDDALREEMIGRVMAVHGWSDRPAGWWPQGEPQPSGSDPVPDKLHWDLWLGVAERRPFKNGYYAHFNWRGCMDFGTGAIGDMACHICDHAFYGLNLKDPVSVICQAEDCTDDQFPTRQTLVMVYEGSDASGGQPIPFYWYDGGKVPRAAALGMPDSVEIPQNFCVVVGEKGTFMCGAHDGQPPRLFNRREEVDISSKVPQMQNKNHYHQWVDACSNDDIKLECTFDRSGPMIESLCLGALSARFPHQQLAWDGESMKFTNNEAANEYVTRQYRSGWSVEGL